MSDMVSNGYLKDKNGKVMEIVDKAARDGVNRLTEEINNVSYNDLKDKPFGENMEEVVVMPEVVLPPSESGESVQMVVFNYPLEVGQTYRVFVDGNDYEVEATENDSSVRFDIVTEAFNVIAECHPLDIEGVVGFASNDPTVNTMEHTVEILTTEKTIKTIDPKYLPTGGFLVTFAYDTQTNGFTCDKSYDEVYDNFDRVEAILVTENAGLYDKQVSKCVQLNRAPDNMIFAFYDIYAPEGQTALRMTKDGTVEDAGM